MEGYRSQVESRTQKLMGCAGLIYPQGSSAPVVDSDEFTVSRSSAGVLVLNFKNPSRYPFNLGFFAGLELATPARWILVFTGRANVAQALQASRNVTLTTLNSSDVAADIPANAQNCISIWAPMQNQNKRVM